MLKGVKSDKFSRQKGHTEGRIKVIICTSNFPVMTLYESVSGQHKFSRRGSKLGQLKAETHFLITVVCESHLSDLFSLNDHYVLWITLVPMTDK